MSLIWREAGEIDLDREPQLGRGRIPKPLEELPEAPAREACRGRSRSERKQREKLPEAPARESREDCGLNPSEQDGPPRRVRRKTTAAKAQVSGEATAAASGAAVAEAETPLEPVPESAFTASWMAGQPAPIPFETEVGQRHVEVFRTSKKWFRKAQSEVDPELKLEVSESLLESFLQARPLLKGPLLERLGQGRCVRDVYSAQDHLTVEYRPAASWNLEGVKVAEGVHGTMMSSIWSIVGDNALHHSTVNVLTRNGEPLEGVYAHAPQRAAKCCFYAPWAMPWGPCGVAARVFVWFKSDWQGVIKVKGSDQLVFAHPLIFAVVFQIAALGALTEGEKMCAPWDVCSERVPKQWSSKLGLPPPAVPPAAPSAVPPSPAPAKKKKVVVRRRVRLTCVASSPETEAAHLAKLNGRLRGLGSERRILLREYRRVSRLVRRADLPRLNQALKRGVWVARRQAAKRIEAEVFRRLSAEGGFKRVPAIPRAAAAAGEAAMVEPHEAPAGPRTYGAAQKKTRNRKKRERKEAKLASSGGGAAGKGPSSSSASRRQGKSWGTSGAAGSQWSTAAWRNESWGSSGAASSQWSAVASESVGARRGLRSPSRGPRRLPTPPRDPRRPEQEPRPRLPAREPCRGRGRSRSERKQREKLPEAPARESREDRGLNPSEQDGPPRRVRRLTR